MDFDVEFQVENLNFNLNYDDETQNFTPDFGMVQTVNIGENGATFIPDVSDDGIISWTNDKNLPNPEPVDITGPQGAQGPQGEKGEPGDANMEALTNEEIKKLLGW